MQGNSMRRRVKRRRKPVQSTGIKLTWVGGIIAVALLMGYLTARFVIGPIIGYNAEESPIEKVQEKESETASKTETEIDVEKGGYSLQFGAFSTKESAESLAEDLKDKGIDVDIIEREDVYKVIGKLTDKKDEALDNLKEAKAKDITDVFIASY